MQLARKRKGLTQEEIASALGIPRATYANVESARQRIGLDIVWKLAALLRVGIDTLVPEAVTAPDPTKEHSTQTPSSTAWINLTAKL